MVYSGFNIHNFSLPMAIRSEAREIAQTVALQQPNRQKAEQVYFNTLAVLIVKDYLEWMEIPTNVAASDSWNPIMRLCENVADLSITNVGRLECRPVLENASTCYIPPETWEDRVGYVAVQLASSMKEAAILGFVERVNSPEFPLSQLQPIEALLSHLENLSQVSFSPITALSQWLEGVFEESWQTVSDIFGADAINLAYSFRTASRIGEGEIQRAKLIDLGMQLQRQPFALLISVTPEGERVAVRVQLHPATEESFLPANVQLRLLTDTGEVLEEVRSRLSDDYIQLPRFRGHSGERFRIQVALDAASVTEDFII
ncbi:MAG: DUF1822 family protein [Halothece sp.]